MCISNKYQLNFGFFFLLFLIERKKNIILGTGTCNHARAPQYYAESIISDTGFWGFKCKNYRDWAFRRCTAANSEELAIMGWKANKK